jgi:hypothetical protein
MGMFEPYEQNEPYNGDARKTIDFAAQVLIGAGFIIREQTESTLRADASRTTDWDRCQALLMNVVAIELRAGGSMLTARAELADYPVLQKILNGFVGALMIGTFYYFMNHGSRPIPAEFRTIFWVFTGGYCLILFLGTLTGTSAFRKFAYHSVDRFLKNVAIGNGTN